MIEPSGAALFRILGPVEVWTGQDWAKIGAGKQRSVLATLLLRPGELVSTDALIDQVWPEKPPARAANLISVYVYHLRKLIGDADGQVIVTRAPGYQLMLATRDLDADRFAALAADGRRALEDGTPELAVGLLDEALGLWRGPALADVPLTQLLTAERNRLEELRAGAEELHAEASLACGRYAEALPRLRRLLADHPLQEKLWALLIRALCGAGRQAEALEVFEQARKTISEELGVDPGAELRQLHQQILAADSEQDLVSLALPGPAPVPPPPIPAQLPADIADFTGRSGQVEQLRELLAGGTVADGSPGAVRVVLVVGPGGQGKTTLMVHAAHLLRGEFPDGQLYASLLGATQPADPAEVLARFLRDLGADPARIPLDAEERAALYRTRLDGRRVLVVLDDARGIDQVRPLLPGSASCAVLITARNWLPELAGGAVLDLDVLSEDEASALFTKIVGGKRVAAEPGAAAEVLTACAGLPLAIRIAGARLATRGNWSIRTLARPAVRRAQPVGRVARRQPGCAGVVRGQLRHPARSCHARWPGPGAGVPPARAVDRAIDQPAGRGRPAWRARRRQSPERWTCCLTPTCWNHPSPTGTGSTTCSASTPPTGPAPRKPNKTARPPSPASSPGTCTPLEAAATVISPQHARVPLDPPPAACPARWASLRWTRRIAWCESERAGLVAATRLAAASGLHDDRLEAACRRDELLLPPQPSGATGWLPIGAGLDSARAIGDRRAQAWMLNDLGMAYGVQRMPECRRAVSSRHWRSIRGRRRAQGTARASQRGPRHMWTWAASMRPGRPPQRSLAIQRQQGNRYLEGVTLGILGRASRELGQFADAVAISGAGAGDLP